MSIIGKGYFINSDGAVIHIVAPMGSIITLNHYTDGSLTDIDKTIIKTGGWPRSGREWVQDYYIRIPEKIFGYWRFSGVKYEDILHCRHEQYNWVGNSITFYISEKKEYLGSCYLNAPILEYDDLEYINLNGYNISTIDCTDIVINAENTTRGIDFLNMQDSSNNKSLSVQYSTYNYYNLISSDSGRIPITQTGKQHFIISQGQQYTVIKTMEDKELIGTALNPFDLYSPDGSTIIKHYGKNKKYIINDKVTVNNQNYMNVTMQSEDKGLMGLVSMNVMYSANGSLKSVPTLNITTQTLNNYVNFYGSYRFISRDNKNYPSYYYPVKRLSDNKVGILHRAYEDDAWGESVVEKFYFLSGENSEYIAGPIRTQRETWINS